jgi:hypothetical protein
LEPKTEWKWQKIPQAGYDNQGTYGLQGYNAQLTLKNATIPF